MSPSIHTAAINPSLDNVQTVLQGVGNPQESIPPVIHIAGTNGKGSVAAFLTTIFQSAGYSVHRYTSPHLLSWTERFLVRNHLISEKDLYEAWNSIPFHLTPFEHLTVTAFLLFSQTPADVVILETGMGGRWDATNVLASPRLTLMTSISKDHTEFLGNTLREITYQKAGIIKPGIPLISVSQPDEVLGVLQDESGKANAPFFISPLWTETLSLPGEHQLQNASLAIAAAHELVSDYPKLLSGISKGLQKTIWPGRMQKVSLKNREVWLDVAHNPDGARILCHFFQRKVDAVIGMRVRKDVHSFLQELAPILNHVTLVSLEDDEYGPAATPEMLRDVLFHLKIPNDKGDIESALKGEGTFPLLITGSFSVIAKALKCEAIRVCATTFA